MEQYRPKRVSVSLPVELYAAPYQPPLRMRIENISTGGAFIKTSLAFSVGEILICKIRLPNMARPCAIISRVARSIVPGIDEIDETTGLGLQFLHGNEMRRKQLAKFVRNREMLDTSRDASRKQHLPTFEKVDENEEELNSVASSQPVVRV